MITTQEMFNLSNSIVNDIWEQAYYNVGCQDVAMATSEQAEAATMIVLMTLAITEATLKRILPEPLRHNVRAALERISEKVGHMLEQKCEQSLKENENG